MESFPGGRIIYAPQGAQASPDEIGRRGGKKHPFVHLTSRERQVLALIAEGQSNKAVARQLGIGVRTIETHRERIMDKLNIHSIAGLTQFAIRNGVIPIDGPRPALGH